MFSYATRCIEQEFTVKKKFEHIWPQLPGVWKIPKSHYNPKNENISMGVLDSSNEATGCTDNNAKNLNSLWCTVAEKSRKTPKLTICQKMDQLFLLCHVHCSLDLVYPKGYNAVFYTVLWKGHRHTPCYLTSRAKAELYIEFVIVLSVLYLINRIFFYI